MTTAETRSRSSFDDTVALEALETTRAELQRISIENLQLRLQVERAAGSGAQANDLLAALEKARAELEQSELSLRTLFDTVPVGLFVVDAQTRHVLDLNSHALKLICARRDQVVGHRCHSVVCPAAEHSCPILDLGQKVDHSERVVLTAEGQRLPVLKSVAPVVMNGRHVLVESFVDITNIKNAENQILRTNDELAQTQKRLIAAKEQAEAAALQDPLTRLPNRRLFHCRLALSLNRAQRHPGYLCAVLYLDLDHFKIVNDSLGHDAGDELLAAIGERLQSALRRTGAVSRMPEGEDLVARLGGDEFAILLDDIRDTADALRVAERIRDILSPAFELRGKSHCVTASIGIATSASRYPTAESMLRDADTAMYRAKAGGRGGHVVFDEAMHATAVERLQLESELRLALDRNEFFLEYQPIVSMLDNRIAGFEALLRWQSPRRGLVPPLSFISVAEETGLIVPIGEWVLHQSCALLRRLQTRFPSNPPLTASVNLSARQFAQPDLVDTIARILQQTGIESGSLHLELTESTAMQAPRRTTAMIEELRRFSVRLSIDDFGTGYSSLDYLDQFSVDTLKIDRHFIARMHTDERCRNIVRTIISLAHNLRIQVVAEGTELPEQVELLRSMHCDSIQGYLFSRPVAPESFHSLLEDQCRPVGQSTGSPACRLPLTPPAAAPSDRSSEPAAPESKSPSVPAAPSPPPPPPAPADREA